MSYDRDHYEALIRRYFQAVDEERIQDILDCFTDDGSIQFAFMDVPAHGRDALRTLFTEHVGRFREHADVVTRVLVQGDRGSSEVAFDGLTHDGRPVHLENCNFYSFRNGKFERVTVYLDTVTLARQLGGA